MDHLGTLNDTTPRIRISPSTPPDHSVVFGLDTKLFMRGHEEKGDWANMGGKGEHGDEIETRSVWRGVKPGTKRNGAKDCRHGEAGCGCVCEGQEGHEGHGGYGGLGHGQGQGQDGDVNGTFVATILPLSKKTLQRELEKLNFEIYRGKHIQYPPFRHAPTPPYYYNAYRNSPQSKVSFDYPHLPRHPPHRPLEKCTSSITHLDDMI